MRLGEFSHKTRDQALKRFESEVFDFLIIGGGITGAAVARDAASRGFRVALIEARDFAFGTSSRSSKLIHGGLRYLEHFEFHLVFEALSERSFLLKQAPNLVKPLPFYIPVYKSDPHGMAKLSLGLWLYDTLSLFRTPGFHRRMGKEAFLKSVSPIEGTLEPANLVGGFKYYDASMWDDVLTIETLRSAASWGACIANYAEAKSPIWEDGRVVGFEIEDKLPKTVGTANPSIKIRANGVIFCAGPWTDQLGRRLIENHEAPEWPWPKQDWLKPSQGVHLVFDFKRLPLQGALVMSHPTDGRISFVIPRPELGAGVTIVGTTDGPVRGKTERPEVHQEDIEYLMALLHRYFPSLNLKTEDIVSAYVGIRPLVKGDATSLAATSREHSIELGPGGVTLVGGGKYTTHRKMAEEIVDFSIQHWHGKAPEHWIIGSRTDLPVNPYVEPGLVKRAKQRAYSENLNIDAKLFEHYGEEALEIYEMDQTLRHENRDLLADPEGFPCLMGQFQFHLTRGSVMRLEDFYFRRQPLFLSRQDHGKPWATSLAWVWAKTHKKTVGEMETQVKELFEEIEKRETLKTTFPSGADRATASRGPGP